VTIGNRLFHFSLRSRCTAMLAGLHLRKLPQRLIKQKSRWAVLAARRSRSM
jgi:hypothetical protein